MEEHSMEVDSIYNQLLELAKSNSLSIHSNISKQKDFRDEIKKSCSLDHIQSLNLLLDKSKKDFDYLLHP
jgi:hypothetical protein